MWAVVLELDGRPPQLMCEYVKLEDAQSEAVKLAMIHQHTGGKVTVSQPDSADQLQRYSKDRFERQEPDKPAVGEDVTVYVPPFVLDRSER